MANQNIEGQEEEALENDEQELETETETSEDEGEAEAKPESKVVGGESTPNFDSRLIALEDQLRRSNEDRETLRETLRLNQQLLVQSQRSSEQKQPRQLTEEQKALRELGLVFGDDVKESMQPLVGTVTNLYDSNDAVMFQLYLSRENPDLLKGEEFDKVSQVVQSVREQQARNGGGYLRREDAYKYAKGAGLILPPKAKAAENTPDTSELKRQAETKAAGTLKQSSKKVESSDEDAEINRIRAKGFRGERLTPKERQAYRTFLADKPF